MNEYARFMLVGGGSGGHFYPLISIATELHAQGMRSLYYMGPEPYDAPLLMSLGIKFIACPAGKKRRYASFANVLDTFKTGFGICVAFVKLLKIYPDVIITKGGYTSVPIVLAAVLLKIPIIVHESDTRPGKANALAARFAKHIAISFEDARPYFKDKETILTGIPMRDELMAPPRDDAYEALGLDPALPVLLVLGGSQGAERVNELILQSLGNLLTWATVIHQTGKAHFNVTVLSAREFVRDDVLLQRYRPIAFFDDPSVLNDAYHIATLIISRAGSTSIYEIAQHGKPSILIPIPETISHDQRTNAYAYARAGATLVLEESNLNVHLLTSEIDRIMKSPVILTEMALKAQSFAPQNGGKAIADMAINIAQEHH